MADHLEHLNGIVEETPSSSISRATSQPTLAGYEAASPSPQPLETINVPLENSTHDSDEHHHHVYKHHEYPPVSSNTPSKPRSRRGSSVSHVDIDYFDPEGVQHLKRTLTKQSMMSRKSHKEDHNAEHLSTVPALPIHHRHSSSSEDDESTLENEPFDFQKTIRRLVRNREKANVKTRELGIVFQNLHVVGLGATASYQPTLASVLNPMSVIEAIQKARHPPIRNILSDFEGVVKPGEMILVLGRPGAGCTTFLKILANQRKEYHKVEGNVHYDSITPDDLYKHFRGDVQYCPEDDIHFPTLSVENTLKFAAITRTPRGRGDLSRTQFADSITDILTTMFGLNHARNTPIGDAAIRGVSGGEKKRVSIAESLAARACIGVWDNSTRGLDASTALEFVRAVRMATDTYHTTNIVSIYQAGEQLYNHFDKVCLIYEGRMAYYGPANAARQYFIDMGYEPVNRQTTADFLVAVTDPNGRIPRAGITGQPRTAAEFSEYFQKSQLGALNKAEIKDYLADFVGNDDRAASYIESAHAEFSKRSRKRSPYLLSIRQQLSAVMRRRVQIMRGNKFAVGLNLFSFIFQAIIMGSVFLRLKDNTSAFFSRGGILFFALLFTGVTSMAEIPALYTQRPIVLRHENAALYHPFIEALALTFVDIPITFVTLIFFGVIVYFMTGLQKSADQFFVFLLFTFIITLVMKAWFRTVAAACKSEATAQSVAGLSILALTIYTGYNIPKPTMIGALRWITFINPLRYGFEVLMSNEFRTLKGSCSNLVPQGAGYENITLANQVCASVGAQPGENFVDGARFVALSYQFYWSNTWKNFGICIAFGVGFLALLLLFSEFNTSLSTEFSVVLFKRGKKTSKLAMSPAADEEIGHNEKAEDPNISDHKTEKSEKAIIAAPRMTNIFSWQHIDYFVPIPGLPDRQLLSDISGYVAPGKLTALMGESGAGKTTLLNVLAQRVSIGVVKGDKFVNGQALPADFQAQTGYVQQMDTHLPTATVREALLFSAKLRQPPDVPLVEKEAYVETCLAMCGLEAYADAAVGSLGTEHRKRTTIGVELAAKPKLLLFLDEPTSGLDSQSAWAIMKFLRDLANNGQAILCTIHQPSAELFQVFDRLLLLKKGGQTVYFGDLGEHASTLIQYFERNGARHCEPAENPAEYMLDIIGAGATATTDKDWYNIWQGSSEAMNVQKEIEEIHVEGRKYKAIEATFHSEFATSWAYQMTELFKRNAESYWRSPTYLVAKLVLNVCGGLFVGFTFWHSKDSQQGTQNKLFAIFMATVICVPLSNQLQVPFISTRTIYEIRERPSRMYSWTALVTAQILIEIPWNFVGSNLLFFCWYFTVGFPAARAGYIYLLLAVAFPLYYTTMGQAVAAMSPSAEIAAVLFSFLFSFVIIFNGVLQPYRSLGWWRWMYRLSPFTYLIEGLLGYALGKQDINCSSVEFVSVNPPSGQTCGNYMQKYISAAGGYLTNPEATSDCKFCSVRTTDEFLGPGFNIFFSHAWRNLGLMFAYILFNAVMVYIFTYLFRIRTGSIFPSFKKSASKKK